MTLVDVLSGLTIGFAVMTVVLLAFDAWLGRQ